MQANIIHTRADPSVSGKPGFDSERSAEEFDVIPAELRERPQWMNWKIGPKKDDGKFKKLPIDPATEWATSDKDPANWQTFEQTVAYYCAGVGDGIAYCFSEQDSYAGIDLDGCRNPATGEISEAALEIIEAAGSDAEISPSESGVKIIGRGVLPEGYSNNGNLPDGTKIEVYDRQRMFTRTGAMLDGYHEIADIQAIVDDICLKYLGKLTSSAIVDDHGQVVGANRSKAVAKSVASDAQDDLAFDSGLIAELTDQEILDEIRQAENAAEFNHLYSGGNGDDVSKGDLLVAQRLSSYTHGDSGRIKQMMSASPRFRKKFPEKHGKQGESFLDLVVDRAVKGTKWLWTVPKVLQNLAAVRKTIRLALDKAKSDNKQAMYKPDVLAALSWLKTNKPGEWDTLRDKLKALKVSLHDLNAAMKSLQDTSHQEAKECQELATVENALPGIFSSGLVIPKGYFINDTCTALLKSNQLGQPQIEPFAHAPVYVTERGVNNEDNLHYLKLGWYQDGRRYSLVVDRGVAMNQAKLQTLASNGFPVTSFNSGILCKYLSDFEAVNRAILPVVRVSPQLGWHGKNGCDGFLLGKCLIMPNGDIVEMEQPGEQQSAPKPAGYIEFHAGSAGERQIADAVHKRGTLDGWLKAIEPLIKFPKAKLGVYVGLVPPLLEVLNAPNFVVDFAGTTSGGKTATQKVSASNWGDPDLRSDAGYIQGWHVTKVFIERAASVLNFMPLILDDTKTVRFKEMVGEVIYQVVSGKGKGRGNIDGLGYTRPQKTVLISSGEGSARESTNDGGSRMRCLEIMNSPFGDVNKKNGMLVTKLESDLYQNYGHTGPAFVQWLCRNRDRWPELKERYELRTAAYSNSATNPQAGRLAKYAAAIDMAAFILHQAVAMPWDYEDPLKELWAEMSAGAAEAPPEIRALQALEGWCYSNETSFYGRHEIVGPDRRPKTPLAGWTGFWDQRNDCDIAFYPDKLDSVLEDLNFKPHEVKAGWRNRGWLEVAPNDLGKRLTVKRTFTMDLRKIKTNFIVIKRAAFTELDKLVGND